MNGRQEGGRRGNILAAALETVVLCGLGLVAIFWIIPAQTSGSALGLNPAFMPTVYASAFVFFVLLNGVLQLSGHVTASPLTQGAIWLVVAMVAICCAGIMAFERFGAAVCALVVIPCSMVALGERRWGLVVGTTVVSAAGLALAVG